MIPVTKYDFLSDLFFAFGFSAFFSPLFLRLSFVEASLAVHAEFYGVQSPLCSVFDYWF